MELSVIQLWGASFPHRVQRFWDSSIFLYRSIAPFFSLLSGISLYLFYPLTASMDISMTSNLGLLGTKLPWAFTCKFLHRHVFRFFLDKCLAVGIVRLYGNCMFSIAKTLHGHFPFCIPNSKVWKFQLFQILNSTMHIIIIIITIIHYYFAYSKMHVVMSHVILAFISLMIIRVYSFWCAICLP